MKTKNNLIQLCLLCAAMLPAVGQAQLAFTTNNGAITITGCYGITNNVKIPDTINNHPVVSIADWAMWPGGMTNVTIPASVTNIGYAAFYYYPNLMSFTVIGGNPGYASAGGVLFNNPMTTLIQCPMAQTGSYTIPGSVINLGDEAFQSCSHLTGVVIPNSVTNIGDEAFNGCSGLTGVAIPDSVTNIGYSAFSFCTSMSSVTIGTNVTSIGGYAFENCSSLTNAILGSGVISIGIDAFESCSALKSVVIPNNVISIGDWAFGYCYSLAGVTLGTNVTSIGQNAFSYCNLTSVGIPSSVASIGDAAFGGCSDLNNFTVDGGNPYYASAGGVLFNKPMTTLIECPMALTGGYTIPNSVTNIGNEAFNGCSGLTSVTILNSVTSIGVGAFGGCSSLTGITIPVTVTKLSDYTFGGCYNLKSITIPNSISSIGFEAFYDCESLTRVTIGTGVTSIGQDAFEYCTDLNQVRFLGNAPSVIGIGPGSADTTVFEGETGMAYYTVNTTGWGATFGGWPTALYSSPAADFTYLINSGTITITGYIGSDTDVTIPPTISGYPVTTIYDNAFDNQTNLTSVTILAGVADIGVGVFIWCSSLTMIVVDAANPNYASVGGVLFNKTMTTLVQYPAGLGDSYVISDGVTNIGNEAFEGCSSLTNVMIGNSVTNIGYNAFYLCSSLTNVKLPGNLTSIGENAFGYCSSLTSVTIPNSVIGIGIFAFHNCSGLTSVTIPNSVGSIGWSAFSQCSGLTNVTIGSGVTDIGVWTFSDCSHLQQAYFQGDAPMVDEGTKGSADTTVFFGETGTVYYISGTAGWGATFGGWPTVALINPATVFTFITNGDNTLTITGYIGTNSDISIPAAINGYPVALIGDNAFYNQANLTSVTMADSVTNIGDSAFYGCSGLTNVTMGNGVTSIGQNAFNSCSLLTSVTIPDSVTSIGEWAFSGCYGLTNVTLGHGVISIGNWAFYWCSSLTSVTIPASVTRIGTAAYGACYSLTTIAADTDNQSYAGAGGVLFNNAMTSLVEYPAGLAGSYVIPDGVTNIGDSAFDSCSGLTSVTISASVTSIGYHVFSGCSGLMNFSINGTNPNYASAGGVLFDNPMTTLLQCPMGLTGSYVIPNGVSNIAVDAFAGCSSLTSVTIPTSFNNIGDSSFRYCYGLTNVFIPYGVTNIGNYAFFNDSYLTSVTIPASATSIGQYAFGYCYNLQRAYFLGNAPSVNGGDGSLDTSVFQGESGTVYYAPDTAGWGANFGGWPTAAGSYQCKPQILGSGGGLGVRNNKFQFTISWAANTIVVVEACTDLANPVWLPVGTNTLTGGPAAFSDPQWTNYPGRFYRLRSQ